MENSNQTSQKSRPLSYVNISCSVNGYSELTCYNSDIRRELRSRENSRDRLPLLLNKSRDGSPLRPGEIPSVPLTTLGGLLSPVAVMELNNKFSRGNPTHPPSKCSGPLRSKSVDRGYLRKERSERQTFFSSFLNNNNDEAGVEIPVVRVNEVYIPERGRMRNRIDHKEGNFRTLEVPFVTPVSVTDNGNTSHSTGKKSFIEQRIERLYGPGALARNYLTPVKAPKSSTVKSSSVSDTKEEKVENSMKGCATPPVFRHLRPEFREQLPVKRTSPVKPVRKLFPPQETQSLPLTSEVDGTSIESKRQAGEILVKSLDVEASTAFTDFPEGHKFLKILSSERERILKLITEAELYLQIPELEAMEDVTGKIRAAIGLAKLLLSQKMEQFAGLCHKNIKPPSNDPFPTTGCDLAGFWDMVAIQVDHVNCLFNDIRELKKANWNIDSVPCHIAPISSGAVAPPKKRTNEKTQNVAVAKSAKAAEAAKSREEARKKLAEMRRASAAAKKKEAGIEIFA